MSDFSTHRRRFKIGIEASPGSLSATDGNPDPTAVVMTAIEGNGKYEHFGDPKVSDIDHDRDGVGRRPGEPDSWLESGAYKQHFAGELTWTHAIRGIGDGTNYDADARPLDMMLRSGLGVIPAPSESGGSGPADTVTAGSSTTAYTGTDGSAYAQGGLMRYDGVGAIGAQAAQVLSADAGTHVVNYNPSFLDAAGAPLALGAADVVRMMRTYWAGDNMTLGSTLAAEIHAPNALQKAVLGRLRQLVIEDGVERRLQMTASVVFAHSWFDHSSADPSGLVTCASGNRIRRIRCQTVYTDPVATHGKAAAGVAIGTGVDGNRVTVRSYKLTITNQLVPVPADNVLGMSDMEVLNTDVLLELETSRPVTAFDGDLFAGRDRAWVQTWGPVGNGEGAAVLLPAAHIAPDASAARRMLPENDAQYQAFSLRGGVPRQLAEPAGAPEIARGTVFFGLHL